MLATFSCASAASGILGKNVRKSLYSISACCRAVEPPSAYQESATASLARAMNSESGYVLIRVCSVMRATSKRLCFMASMERSNRTLSGCLEPTLASGLLTFLLVQAAVKASKRASSARTEIRRIEDLKESGTSDLITPAANWRCAPLRAGPARCPLDRLCRRQRSRPPGSQRPSAQCRRPCPRLLRHPLRYDRHSRARPEVPPSAASSLVLPE